MTADVAADKIAIVELVARYNHAIDHQDTATWVNLFTEDGLLLTDDKIRAQGRDALRAYAGSAPPEGRSRRHWTSNIVIDIDGETAVLKAYVMVFNLAEGLSTPYLMAEYDDRLIKVDGQWRFKLRHMRVLRGGPSTTRPGAKQRAPRPVSCRRAISRLSVRSFDMNEFNIVTDIYEFDGGLS